MIHCTVFTYYRRLNLICDNMYLEWQLKIGPVTLGEFEQMICKDSVSPGPYLHSAIDKEVDADTH